MSPTISIPRSLESFQAYIQRLLTEDPHALYMERLLNAMRKMIARDAPSGLGFLTILNDYGATLAWEFLPTWLGEVGVTA